jgi:hypothetical protein
MVSGGIIFTGYSFIKYFMPASDPELQFLLHTYAAARNKYKPSQVSVFVSGRGAA